MKFSYQGHVDTYYFDSDAKNPDYSEKSLRFAAFEYEPYTMISFLGQNQSVRSYNIWGPIYSLVKETADKYNLSLYYFDCYRNKEAAARAPLGRLVDVFAFPTVASTDSTYKFWNAGFYFPLPFSFGIMSMDHIIFPIRHATNSIFQLTSIFDVYTWFGLLLSLIILIVILTFLFGKKSFLKNAWCIVTSCWHPVKMTYFDNEKWFLGLWCLTISFLTNCYSGQLFTVISMEPEVMLINSWDDLEKSEVPIIAGLDIPIDYKMMNEEVKGEIEKYIIPDAMNKDSLRKRLTTFPNANLFFQKERAEVLEEVLQGKALLWKEAVARYFIARNKTWREQLHVSGDGGNVQPMFLSVLPEAKLQNQYLKKVVVGLTEAGIYQLWYDLAVKLKSQNFLASLKTDAKAMKIDSLMSVVVVLSVSGVCILLVYIYENLRYKKVSRRRHSFRRRYCDSLQQRRTKRISLFFPVTK